MTTIINDLITPIIDSTTLSTQFIDDITHCTIDNLSLSTIECAAVNVASIITNTITGVNIAIDTPDVGSIIIENVVGIYQISSASSTIDNVTLQNVPNAIVVVSIDGIQCQSATAQTINVNVLQVGNIDTDTIGLPVATANKLLSDQFKVAQVQANSGTSGSHQAGLTTGDKVAIGVATVLVVVLVAGIFIVATGGVGAAAAAPVFAAEEEGSVFAITDAEVLAQVA